MACQIDAHHCEQCGRIIGDECGEWEGYTSCCNELATFPAWCRGYHDEDGEAASLPPHPARPSSPS